jgi:sec-independent protein translocase protein TatB
MFDVGFSELVLIMVVALVVIGPERLPRLARTAGLYLGRARSMLASVKADVKRELAAEDLKRTLQQQAESTGLHDIIEETREAATAAERLLKPDAQSPQTQDQPAEPQAGDTPATGLKHGGD